MESMKRPFGGPLDIGYVDDHNQKWSPIIHVPHNLVLFGAADILARLVSGNDAYALSTVYLEFTNGAAPSVTAARDEGQSYYNGLDGVNKDFLRTEISFAPAFTASSGDYTGNIANFFGLSSGSTGVKGLAFNQGAGSKVYGGALVASPTGAFSGDVVFARFYFTALTKLNGSQIAIKWPIQF